MPEYLCVNTLFYRIIPGIDQVIWQVMLKAMEKMCIETDGKVEIGKAAPVFCIDKFEDIRMGTVEHCHVCPSSFPALFYGIGGLVKDAYEREWSACSSKSRGNGIPGRTDMAE